MPSRRRFLAALTATGTVTLAGCNSLPFVGGDGTTGTDATPSDDFPRQVHVSSGWPNPRRDPAHTACVPDADRIQEPSVEWRSGPVSSTTKPTVAGATVLCGSEALRGLDVVSGDELWSTDASTGRFAVPVVDDVAYASTGTVPGRGVPGVVAVDVVEGRQMGSTVFPAEPIIPPTIPYDPNRTTRFYPFQGSVMAYRDGEVDWKNEVFGHNATPLAYNVALVVAATGAGELYAFGISGRGGWRTDFDDSVATPPVVGSQRVYVGTRESTVAVSRHDGGVAWREDVSAAGPLALDHDHLYVPRSRALEARSPETGGVVWNHDFPASVTAAPAVGGDTVYVGTQDGKLRAIDTASGDERWAVSVGVTVGPTVVVADGRLYTVAQSDDEPQIVALA